MRRVTNCIGAARDARAPLSLDSGGAASAIRDFLTRTEEDKLMISRAEAALKDANDDLQKCKDAFYASKADSTDEPAEPARGHPDQDSPRWSDDVSNAEKNRRRAEAELCDLELKLLKSSGALFHHGDLLDQFRAIYKARELIDLLELGSSGQPGDISDVRAARSVTRRPL